ncbi:MAG: homoserine kinase [Planctomycetota bacterium]|nr:MAG: homoserine kinase [Planctomycetota bacterium]
MPAMRIRVPASTSNLGHGFDCLGMALTLANEITVLEGPAPAELRQEGLERLCGAVREQCQQVFGGPALPEVHLQITGTVPIARGLGSSATIILALAAAYQRLAGRDEDRQELVRIGYGIEGHPDNVAAAALGGFTIAAHLASGLRCLHFPVPAELGVVVVIPDYEVVTAAARRVLPESLSREEAVRGWQRASLISAALASGQPAALVDCFQQAWHEHYRAELNPELEGLRAAAGAAGAWGTFLSGSGSTILSLCPHSRAAAIAETLSAHLRAKGTSAQVQACQADNQGLCWLPD